MLHFIILTALVLNFTMIALLVILVITKLCVRYNNFSVKSFEMFPKHKV